MKNGAQMAEGTQVNKAIWKLHGHNHLGSSKVSTNESLPSRDKEQRFPSRCDDRQKQTSFC